MLTHDNTEFIL